MDIYQISKNREELLYLKWSIQFDERWDFHSLQLNFFLCNRLKRKITDLEVRCLQLYKHANLLSVPNVAICMYLVASNRGITSSSGFSLETSQLSF